MKQAAMKCAKVVARVILWAFIVLPIGVVWIANIQDHIEIHRELKSQNEMLLRSHPSLAADAEYKAKCSVSLNKHLRWYLKCPPAPKSKAVGLGKGLN
jgi:hypothetical protein